MLKRLIEIRLLFRHRLDNIFLCDFKLIILLLFVNRRVPHRISKQRMDLGWLHLGISALSKQAPSAAQHRHGFLFFPLIVAYGCTQLSSSPVFCDGSKLAVTYILVFCRVSRAFESIEELNIFLTSIDLYHRTGPKFVLARA